MKRWLEIKNLYKEDEYRTTIFMKKMDRDQKSL